MKKIILIVFIFVIKNGNAQYLDTLREVFKHKAGIDARFETRYSFLGDKIISVTGLRLGIAFQKKLRIGAGLSWLKTDYKKTFYQPNDKGTNDTVNKYLKFGYICFYADFVFYKEKRWQLSVPIQVGGGLGWYQKNSGYNLYGPDKKYFLLLYEPGITVQFKVLKWFGLGSDIAYRFATYNKKIGEHLNSPTYSFKILIWFDQIYYTAFPNSKLTQKYGPASW